MQWCGDSAFPRIVCTSSARDPARFWQHRVSPESTDHGCFRAPVEFWATSTLGSAFSFRRNELLPVSSVSERGPKRTHSTTPAFGLLVTGAAFRLRLGSSRFDRCWHEYALFLLHLPGSRCLPCRRLSFSGQRGFPACRSEPSCFRRLLARCPEFPRPRGFLCCRLSVCHWFTLRCRAYIIAMFVFE